MNLLEICAKGVLTYGTAMGETGVDLLNTGDSTAGGSLISAKDYAKFALPFERYVFDGLKAKGFRTSLYIWGEAAATMQYMVQANADVIEFDHLSTPSGRCVRCRNRLHCGGISIPSG